MTEFPPLLFFFGLAGAGKTYVGNLIAAHTDYFAYDLDQDLPLTMKQAIAKKEPFTDSMRDEYFLIISERIKELRREHPRLLCMQGAYKKRHREMLHQEHPDICFVWVKAEQDVMEERLRCRGDEISPSFAAQIARNFEAPSEGRVLENNKNDAALLKEFFHLFDSSRDA